MDSHTIIITEIESVTSLTSSISSDYVVEEPYDYIFEPDHYPLKQQQQQHHYQKKSCSVVEEKDGMLIYQYSSSQQDTNEKYDHLNALLRNISLTKSPHTGFGFDLSREQDLMYVRYIYI